MAASTTSRRICAAALLLVGAVVMSGCSSVIDHIPTWAGGLPEGVPDRHATPQPFPQVHDMPPRRDDVALSNAERARLKAELSKTRAQNEQAAKEATGSTAGTTRNP